MNLIKTSFWSGISTVLKVLAGLVTTKIMAIFVGPSGVALFGNFMNVTGIFSVFSNGGISSGVTKYIAEYDCEDEKRSVVSHAIKINIFCSILIGLIVLVLNRYLTILTFGNLKFNSVFICFGITIIFYGLNSTMNAIINGYKRIKYLVLSGIIGSVISLVLAVIITVRYGIFGALINVIISQVCIFLVNMYFVKKLNLLDLKILNEKLNINFSWKLIKFAMMTFFSALIVPISTLMIRKYIYSNFSANEAGYVQGVWGISNTYLLVITTTLSIYYLPTLSSIKDKIGIRKEIIKGYKILLPLAIIFGIIIFLCRDLIIFVLYTPSFLPMKKYFNYQIIGDILKISSWILSYLMVARAMTRWFIISEFCFSVLYVGLSFLFMSIFGSIGVMYAYALNYTFYLLFQVILFRDYLFLKSSNKKNEGRG